MACVRIRLPRDLVTAGAGRELRVEALTVREALVEAIAREPRLRSQVFRDDGRVWVVILVNECDIRRMHEMDTFLSEGDEIRFLRPIPGG